MRSPKHFKKSSRTNAHDKSALIAELSQALLSKGIKVVQGKGGADLSSASHSLLYLPLRQQLVTLLWCPVTPMYLSFYWQKLGTAEAKFRASTLFHSASTACRDWV